MPDRALGETPDDGSDTHVDAWGAAGALYAVRRQLSQ